MAARRYRAPLVGDRKHCVDASPVPDAENPEALDLLLSVDLKTPIVILTDNDDTNLASQALARGAQDFLVKGEIMLQLLVRSIRHVVDRRNLENKVKTTSMSPVVIVNGLNVQLESSLRMVLMHAQNLPQLIEDDETRQMAVAIEIGIPQPPLHSQWWERHLARNDADTTSRFDVLRGSACPMIAKALEKCCSAYAGALAYVSNSMFCTNISGCPQAPVRFQ